MSDQETVDDNLDEASTYDDSSDVDVEDYSEDLMPANIALLLLKYDDDDEPWDIETDSSSSDESDENLLTHLQEIKATNCEAFMGERGLAIGEPKNVNSVNLTTSNNEELNNPKLKEESDLPLPVKKCKYSQDNNDADDMDVDSKSIPIKLENDCTIDQTIIKKEQLEADVKSSESNEQLSINDSQDSSKLDRTLFDLPEFNSTNLASSSCSTAWSSVMSRLLNLSNFSELNMGNEHTSEHLSNSYDNSNLNGSCKSAIILKKETKLNEDVKVLPIEKCHLFKDIPTRLTFPSNRVPDPQTENPNCFVEDKDFVNPDILYNINLNEHYKQMDVLVQKISKATDDQTLSLLDECVNLMPIPRIEHEKKSFTLEQRLNFLNGIPEWEYEIDGDNWNKIMVKRAVVFTAHAGFSIANEESLYVLADVAIDYIKKLAIIMKRNFDIQLNSSCPDSIDPINNSLQEIGVNGGITELIKHYDNDVYDRRNKLLKKCQHLQKIIDQFIKHKLLDPQIKNQYVVKQEPGREDLASGKFVKREENGLLKEIKIEMDSTVEVKSEMQSTIENIKMESQSMADENLFTNTEVEQTEPVYVDNIDNEVRIDIDSRNIENIKSELMDIGDRKINYMRTMDVKKKVMEFDLLKPLSSYVYHAPKTWATNKIDQKYLNVSESRNHKVFDIRRFQRPFNIEMLNHAKRFPDCLKRSSTVNCKSNGKSSNLEKPSTPIYSQPVKEECHQSSMEVNQILTEFDEKCKRFNTSLVKEEGIPSNDSVGTQCKTSVVNNNHTQVKIKLEPTNNFDTYEGSNPNGSNIIQNIKREYCDD